MWNAAERQHIYNSERLHEMSKFCGYQCVTFSGVTVTPRRICPQPINLHKSHTHSNSTSLSRHTEIITTYRHLLCCCSNRLQFRSCTSISSTDTLRNKTEKWQKEEIKNIVEKICYIGFWVLLTLSAMRKTSSLQAPNSRTKRCIG